MKLLSIIFILIFTFTAFGQAKPQTLLVKLSVQSPDPTLKTLLLNKLSAEFNQLKDVELTDKLNIYELEVVAMEIKTSTGIFIGYALSTTITRTELCKSFLSDEETYKPIGILETHTITLTDKTRMQKDLNEIVSYLNAKLEPIRKASKNIKVIPRNKEE